MWVPDLGLALRVRPKKRGDRYRAFSRVRNAPQRADGTGLLPMGPSLHGPSESARISRILRIHQKPARARRISPIPHATHRN
eukprot:2389570-Prymnesium_polylepis.1